MNNTRRTFAYAIALVAVICGSFVFAVNASAFSASFNPEINYQGRLVGLSNVAVPDSPYNMRFSLYTTPTGGVPIWQEVDTGDNRPQVTSGLFSIMLGSTTPLTNIDFNQTLYLGVEIGGLSTTTPVWDGEMVPRKIIGAVPAAFVANNVIGDIASTTFATSTYATSTNFFATNSVLANATTTNLFAQNFSVTTASSTNLFSSFATLTNLLVNGSSTLQNFTFTNATGTSATTTNFFSTNLNATNATTTNFFSTNVFGTTGNLNTLLLNGSSTLQNFTGVNATTTNATSTNFFSDNGTFTNLFVNNYEQNNGTFNITSTVPTGDIFSVFDNAVTDGTLIHQKVTANAGNGQISKGQTIDLTDSTTAGGGYTALAINVSGAGSGSGPKNLLDLNPGTDTEVVFDSTGAFRPTTDASVNTNSIGTPSFYWKNGYFDTITANNISGTVVSGATAATTWTIGSTQTGDVNEALVFQRNSGSGNATLQWNASSGTLNDQRYLSANYPFNVNYTVDNSSIGTNVNLYSGLLTNNTTSGTQKLLSLTNTGTGTTEDGIYLNNTGTAATALEIAGSWTTGILTNNNSINAGTGAISGGAGTFANLLVNGSSTLQNFTATNATTTNATSSTLYVAGQSILAATSGKVGIGTTTPAFQLDVNSSASTIASIFKGSNLGAVGIGSVLSSSGAGTGFLQAYSNDNAVATANLSLEPTAGLVGIGTSTPTNLLDLATGNNGTIGLIVHGTTVNSTLSSQTLTLNSPYGAITGSSISGVGGVLALNSSSNGLTFGVAGSVKETVTSRGDFGIGTTTPTATLSIFETSANLNANNLAFSIGSSTAAFATSTLFSVSNTGLATLTNLLVTGSSTLQNFTFVNATGTSATTTNFFTTTASSTNLFFTNANGGLLTDNFETTNNLLVNGSSTLQNFTFVNATGTSATTTNLFSTNVFGSVLNFSGLGTLGNLLVNGSSTLQNFTASNSTTTNATTTNFFATTASTTNLFFTNATGGLLTANSATAANLRVNGSSTFQNFTFVNATGTSATTTNFFATNVFGSILNFSGLGTVGNLLVNSSSTLQNFTGLNSTTTNATSTNLFTTTASTTNLFFTNATGGLLADNFETTNNLLVNGSTTLQNLTFTNATGTSATTTNFFTTNLNSANFTTTNLLATNSTTTNATSTNLFSTNATFTNATFATVITTTESLSNLLVNGSSTLQNFTFVNATGTSATTTNLFSTNVFGSILNFSGLGTLGNLLVTGSSTLQNFTGVNATTTNATTTNFAVSGSLYTSLTQNSIPFIGANGLLTQNNANLNWNNGTSLLTVVGNASTTEVGTTQGAYFATTAGNVGIGTTTPNTKLTVKESASGNAILAYGGGSTLGGGIVQGNQTLSQQWLTAVGGGDNSFVAGNGWFLRDVTANKTRLVVDTSGNVGIGTTSPVAKLQIYPNSNSTIGLIVQGDNNASLNIQQWQNSASAVLLAIDAAGNISRPSTTGTDLKITQGNSGNSTIFLNNTTETFRTNASYAVDARTSALPIRLANTDSLVGRNAANSSDITIANVDASNNVRLGPSGELTVVGGNVGIGTTSPTSLLSIFDTPSNLNTSAFSIGSSTSAFATTTLFNVANNGNVSLGIASTKYGLEVDPLVNANTNVAYFHGGTNGVPSGTWSYGFAANSTTANTFAIRNTSSNPITGTVLALETAIASASTYNFLTAASSGGTQFSVDGAGDMFVNGSTTLQNFTASNSTTTNATSTNFFATNANFTTLSASTLSLTNLLVTGSSTLQNFTFVNATGTSATTTNLFSINVFGSILNFSGLGTLGNLLVNGSSTLQNFTASNSTTTNATSSTLYVSGQTILAATSGSVGIGTTTPAASLDVFTSGDVNNTILKGASNNNYILTVQNAGGAGQGLFLGVGNTGSDASIISANNFTGTNFFTVTDGNSYFQNGNVGIGTTTPTSGLSVYGNGQTTSALNTDGNLGGAIKIIDSGSVTGNGGALLFGAQNSGVGKSFAAIKGFATNLGNNGVGDLTFSTRVISSNTTLTEQMRLTSAGNLGIGTTTPGQNLQVNAAAGIAPSSTSGAIPSGMFGISSFPNTSVSMMMGIAGTSQGFPSGLSWIQSQKINDASQNFLLALNPNGGNVGVGTTTPDALLDVHGTFEATGSSTLQNFTFVNATGTSATTTNLFSTNVFGSILNFSGLGTLGNLLVTGSSTLQNFTATNSTSTNATSSTLYVSGQTILAATSGNVGIKTTNPAFALDVTGDISATGLYHVRNDQNTFDTTDSHPVIYGTANGGSAYPFLTSGNLVLQSRASGGNEDIVFVGNTTPTVQMVIQGSTGNVGIGTTTPGARLDVTENNSANVAANPAEIIARNINASGYAGIEIDRQNANRASEVRFTTNNANDWTIGTLYGGGASNSAFSIGTDGTLANAKVTLTTAGKFGVGTTTPGSTLSVGGTGGASIGTDYGVAAPTNGLIVEGEVGIGTTAPNDALVVNGNGRFGTNTSALSVPTALTNFIQVVGSNLSDVSGIRLGNNDGTQNSRAEIAVDSTNKKFLFDYSFSSGGALDYAFNALGNNLVTIKSTGLVGIGTTTPSQKLQVDGGNFLVDNSSSGDTNSGLRIVAPIGTSHFNWLLGAQNNVNGGFEITPSTAVGGTTFSTPTAVFTATGLVGIGTKAPNFTLEVNGTASTTNLYATNATTTNATTTNFSVSGNLDTSLTQGSVPFIGAGGLLTQNNSQLFWDNTKDNLGLGTTTPLASLSVLTNNSGISTATNQAPAAQFGVAGTNSMLEIGVANINSLGNRAYLQSGSYANGTNFELYIQPFGANTLINPSGGRVGIGTTSPTNLLDLAVGNNGATGLIVHGTTQNATLSSQTLTLNSDYGTTDGASVSGIGGVLALSSPSNGLTFNVAGSVEETVTSRGDFGIGTTSPTATLSVFETPANLNANNLAFSIGSSTAAFATSTLFSVSNTGLAALTNLLVNGSTTLQNFTATNSTTTNATSSTLYVSGNADLAATGGAVGIATTSPTSLLSIGGGSGTASSMFDITTSGATPRSLVFTANDPTLFGGEIGMATNQGMSFITSNTPRITISSAGSVGIGTTTPGKLLDVEGTSGSNITSRTLNYGAGRAEVNIDGGAGSAGDSLISFFHAGVSEWSFFNSAATNRLRLDSPTTQGVMMFLQNGEIAVGSTTAPTAQLNVFGNGTINPFVVSSSTNAALLTVDTAGNVTIASSGLADGQNPILTLNGRQTGVATRTGTLQVDTTGNFDVASMVSQGKTLNLNDLVVGANTGTLYGSSTASANLTLDSTSNGSKGNVIIAPSGGIVGIGTTTPVGAGLTISAASTPQLTFADQSLSAGNHNFFERINPNVGTGGTFQIGSAIDAGSANNINLSLDRSGNVGVGTTTPAFRLDVNSSASTVASIFKGSNLGAVALGSINNSAGVGTGLIQAYTNDNGLATANLTLEPTAGLVGIGTTTPTFALDVSNTGGNLLRLTNTNSGTNVTLLANAASQNAIRFGNAATQSTPGGIVYDNSNNSMFFNTNSNQRLTIDSSGDVGIGTTTPAQTLDVASSNTVAAIFAGSKGSNNEVNGAVGIGSLASASGQGAFIQAYTNENKAGSADLLLNPNGTNVGIGSSIAPNFNLEVYGTASTTNLFATTATLGTLLVNGSTTLQNFTFTNATGTSATTTNFFATTASSTNLFFTNANGGLLTDNFETTNNLLVNGSSTLQNFTFVNATGTSATTTNFNISTTNGVGIGTASPTNTLDVNGGIQSDGPGIHSANFVAKFSGLSNTGYLQMQQTGQGTWFIAPVPSSPDLFLAKSAATTSDAIMYFANASGNVAIGASTTPWGKFNIDTFNGGSAPQFVVANSTGSGATTTTFMIDSTGKVGIGNAANLVTAYTPGYDIEVRGTSNTNAGLFHGGTGGTPAGTFTWGFTGNSPTATTLAVKNTDSSGVTGSVFSVDIAQPAANTFKLITASSNAVNQFTVNGVGDMFVNGSTTLQNFTATNGTTTSATSTNLYTSGQTILAATSGNVGIDTANPGAKLDVAGAIEALNGYGTIPTDYSAQSLVLGAGGTSPNSSSVMWGDGTGWKLNFGPNVSGTFTPKVTFVDNGNVGIGTSSPGAKLDVFNASTDTTINLGGSTTSNGSGITDLSFYNAGSTLGSNVLAQIKTLTGATKDTGQLEFNVKESASGSVTPAMFISDSGHVGIGTASPLSTLDTKVATDQHFIVGGPLHFADGITLFSVNDADSSVKSMEFGASQYNFGGGNVGIGNSSPNAELSVLASGATDLSGSAASTLFRVTGSTLGTTAGNSVSEASFGSVDSNHTSLGIRNYRFANGSDWTTTGIMLSADVDNTTAVNSSFIFVSTNGNIGISTTTPRSQLTVVGRGQTTAALTDSGNTGGTLQISDAFDAAGAGGALTFTFESDTGAMLPAAAIKLLETNGTNNGIGDLAFSTRNAGTDTALTQQMTLKANGFLGLGTSTPSQKLVVQGNLLVDGGVASGASPDANSGLRLVAPISTTQYNWMIGAQQNVGGAVEITPSTAVGGTTFSTPTAVFTETGRVGIGTTGPSQKLEVNGNILADGELISTDGSSAGGNLAFGNSADNVLSGNSGGTLLTVNSAGYTNVAIDGNVGIATTTPQEQLVLNGAMLISGSGGSSQEAGTLVISKNPSGGSAIFNSFGTGTGYGNFVFNSEKGDLSANEQLGYGHDTSGGGVGGILTVNGTILQTRATNCSVSADASGKLICTSDANLKHDISPYAGGLEVLEGIQPSFFSYNGETYTHVGFIAQNVQTVLPYATPLQTNGFLGLDVNAIVAASVNAIKELDTRTASTTAWLADATSSINSITSAIGLNLADVSAGLDIGSNVTIRGALHVDQIGSIGDILSLESDVNFIGRPYFNSDTGGLAIVEAGATQVDVAFSKPYVNAPVVNASLSFDASSTNQDVQNILSNSVGYAVVNRSQNGFSILLSKPAPQAMTFSWIALAIQNMRIADSGTTNQQTVSNPSNNPSTPTTSNPVVSPSGTGGSSASSTPDTSASSTPSTDSSSASSTPSTDITASSTPSTDIGSASSTPSTTIDSTGSTASSTGDTISTPPPTTDTGTTADTGSTTPTT